MSLVMLAPDPSHQAPAPAAAGEAPARGAIGATSLPALPAPQLHDVTIRVRKRNCCARVQGVPPEEFGIARNARNIRDCGYCFHEVVRRETDLIAEGYDAEQIHKLPGRGERHTPEA